MRGPFKFKLFDQNQKIASGYGNTPTEAAEEMTRRARELEADQIRRIADDRHRKIRELERTRRGG